MSPKKKQSPESIVREIKRRTRRKFSAEEVGWNHDDRTGTGTRSPTSARKKD